VLSSTANYIYIGVLWFLHPLKQTSIKFHLIISSIFNFQVLVPLHKESRNCKYITLIILPQVRWLEVPTYSVYELPSITRNMWSRAAAPYILNLGTRQRLSIQHPALADLSLNKVPLVPTAQAAGWSSELVIQPTAWTLYWERYPDFLEHSIFSQYFSRISSVPQLLFQSK
jgi:hypothetical protein